MTGVRRRPPDARVPLSLSQERLLLLGEADAAGGTYHRPLALRIEGPLEPDVLRRAVEEVFRRHEALRTCFPADACGRYQRIAPQGAIEVPFEEIAGEELLGARLRQEAARPIDLQAGPTARAIAFRLGPEHHVLLLAAHHVLFDGWSARIFRRELAALLGAWSLGRPSPLAEPPIGYGDFALWQREEAAPFLDEQLRWWTGRLRGAPTVLGFPTDRPRPSRPTGRGGRRSISLPASLRDAIKAAARAEGATLFMAIAAALQVLVSRHTGLEDFLLGFPAAGRTRTEVEGVIGLFVNTLVLRADLTGDPTIPELLARTRREVLEAWSRQDLPLDRLVREMEPERSPGLPPLVQVLFQLRNLPAAEPLLPELRSDGLRISEVQVEAGAAKFDLHIELEETSGGLEAAIEYAADLFDPGTIDLLLGRLETLLRGFAAGTRERASEIPLLPEDERRRVLIEWNDTGRPFPGERIESIFAARARTAPEAAAVSRRGRSISYGELDRRSARLARLLRKRGLGRGMIAAALLESSGDAPLAYLGILRAGAAYLPLDPMAPPERNRAILEDAGVRVAVVERKMRDRLPAGLPTVVIEELGAAEEIGNGDGDGIEETNQPTAEEIALVIHTSGSTGKPKGVAIPHRAAVRLVLQTDYVQIGPHDRVAQSSSLSFDAAVFEIWGALLNGATLVPLERAEVLSPRRLARRLEAERVTILFLTTSVFHLVAREEPRAFRGLRHLLVGGERMDPRRAADALRELHPGRLLNCYGPTEAATFSTWHQVDHVEDGAAGVPIGKPIANTRVYLLDRRLQPAPPGAAGEVCIAGPGLATGYLGRPDLTAERFMEWRAPGLPAERIYRTGDLARLRPDGLLEFLGRTDGQVKVRGFRVEPGEVEAALARHPSVRQAYVTGREDDGVRRLVAYLAPAEGKRLHAPELRRHLEPLLPPYMVPAAFVVLDRLPLGPTGKVDAPALPPPGDLPRRVSRRPRDSTERHMARIWERALGVRRVGIDEDFFALGGHSLLAAGLIDEVWRTFGRELPLSAVLDGATVEGLARLIREEERPRRDNLVLLRPGGLPALFCVHPAGGRTRFYQPLAEGVGPERAVWGIEEEGRRGGRSGPTRVEATARRYLDAVLAIQPEGPYLIAGYSFGGFLAFEMARQLVERGRRVGLLAILDTKSPNLPRSAAEVIPGPPVGRMVGGMGGAALSLLRPGRRAMLAGLAAKARRARDAWGLWAGRRALSALYRIQDRRGRPFPATLRNRLDYYFYLLAGARYSPRPFPGRITLFRSSDSAASAADPLLGWGELALGGVEVEDIQGSHLDLISVEHMAEIGRRLRPYVEEKVSVRGEA